MKHVLDLGQMLTAHARLSPQRIGARDLERSMTFHQWNSRACRLANALLGLGLSKGDRVAILAYNTVEWVEIYAAAAKAGIVAVPLNFRLVGKEIRYIVDDAEAAAIIVQDQLVGALEDVGPELSVQPSRRIWFGKGQCPAGYVSYEKLMAGARDSEPEVSVTPEDPWMLMYTSGTTGVPKGAIRNHRGGAMLSLITEIELGMHRNDGALLVMPMCHANSLYFFGAFAYCGATTTVYSRKSFDPEHCARVLGDGVATFTSLVPTHYAMMLALPQRDARAAQPRQGRQAHDLFGACATGRQARHHGDVPERRPLRTLRLDRDWLGDHASSARAVRQARLRRPRMRRFGCRSSFSIRMATKFRTAKSASFTPAILTFSTAIGSCRKKRARRSAATIARSATWRAGTPTASSISSIARAT